MALGMMMLVRQPIFIERLQYVILGDEVWFFLVTRQDYFSWKAVALSIYRGGCLPQPHNARTGQDTVGSC